MQQYIFFVEKLVVASRDNYNSHTFREFLCYSTKFPPQQN